MVTNRDRKSFGSRRPKRILKVAQTTFFICVQAFWGSSRRASASPNLHEQWTQLAYVRCPVAHLLILLKSSGLPRSVIFGVVTILGRPGGGASQEEKSPRLNWATQFLTVAYDGACFPNVSIRMAWISFLMTVRVSVLLKSCVSSDMLPFSLCNEIRPAIRHMNRLLLPMTLSILSYDIGK